MLRSFSGVTKFGGLRNATRLATHKPSKYLEFDENDSILIYKYTHTANRTTK